jgi:hypothetical protein
MRNMRWRLLDFSWRMELTTTMSLDRRCTSAKEMFDLAVLEILQICGLGLIWEGLCYKGIVLGDP